MPIVAIPQHIEQRTADSLLVNGVLTDGTFKQQFGIVFQGPTTVEQARQQIAALLTSNQAQAQLQKVLQVGVSFDLTPPIVAPPDPPTQDQIDRAAYFAAVILLQQYRAALSPTHQALVDQQALVDKLLRPEFYA